MTGPTFRSQTPRAFTLIELLIVVAIMCIFAATAIPRLAPAFQDRKTREASRQLNAFFANAKAMAAERNRPVGVWFERTTGIVTTTPSGTVVTLPDNLNQCLQIYLAEVPPPYIGDFANAFVTVNNSNNTTATLSFLPNNSAVTSLTASSGGLLKTGDPFWIRFDYQGQYYQGIYDGSNMTLLNTIAAPSTLPNFPLNSYPNGVRFQILLRPQRSSIAPLALANGIAIDLSLSGTQTFNPNPSPPGYKSSQGDTFDAWNPSQFPDRSPVIVLFTPSGQVSQVFSNGGVAPPSSPINFLIGRSDTISPIDGNVKCSSSNTIDLGNLQDSTSFWFTIGQRNGTTTTAENFWSTTISGWSSPNALPLSSCRSIALAAQTKGGG